MTGTSAPFNVYRFENFNAFYRKGEDMTLYDIYKKYSHFDIEQQPLFNSYLSASLADIDSFGGLYDKIKNFAKDTSDVDLCTIDNLYSVAEKMDYSLDDFGLNFPSELSRYMNMFSIPLQKLIGTRCACNNNFNCQNCCGKNICSVCGFDKKSNLGSQLSLTDYVPAVS